MSYVEGSREEETPIKSDEKIKIGNPIKEMQEMLTEDTIVETYQDIIDNDKDEERKNAFKDAETIIEQLDPKEKKKRKKSKEKEEFNRNLTTFTKQNQPLKKEVQETKDKPKDKQMELGE